VSSDERPDSLAAQAAAWVPPWQRPSAAQAVPDPAAGGPDTPDQPPPGERDTPVEGADEPGDPPIPPPLPAETPVDVPPTVDAPVPVPDEEPLPLEPDIPIPDAPAPEEPPETGGIPIDSPAPPVDAAHPRTPAKPSDGAAPGPVAGPPAADPPSLAADAELRAALEAVLLVVDEPVAEIVLAQVLEQPTARVAALLDRISADYTAAGHGFDLRRAAGGWRLYTRPEYAEYVERFVLNGQSLRLTQAALEALAVVAYKQPVTRSRISAIRGVNCDGVMRTLVTRGLVEECGTEPATGAFLYRTTVLFLEKLGLDSVDQLPPLAPFLPDNVEEIFDAQH
jgi:segregation and condensation protein B